MAIVFASNVIEIAAVHTYAGRTAVNVWHMYHVPELGSDDKALVVQDFADNWQDHVLQGLDSGVVIQSFEWRSLDPDDGSVGTHTPNTGKPGTGQVIGAGAPPNAALLVHKNTTTRPRGRRDGRSYLVGVAEAETNEDGTLSGTFLSAMNGHLADFYSGISDTATVWGGAAGDQYPVVLETTPASRAPGDTAVTINSRRVRSITLDPMIATQRDRLR